MTSSNARRIVVLVAAVAGSALLQACATKPMGPWSPSKATPTNHSMTSRFDVTRQQAGPNMQYRLNTSRGGVSGHKYY